MKKTKATNKNHGLPGNTPAEMRKNFIAYVEPVVAEIFRAEPTAQAVLLVFAQYWNDEADDAVHVRLLPTRAPGMTLKDACDDRCNDPRLVDRSYDIRDRAETAVFGKYKKQYWENTDLITAFACFTEEGASQEDEMVNAYSVYAEFTRSADPAKPTKKIVGTKLRPHLEGTRSSWEMEDQEVEYL